MLYLGENILARASVVMGRPVVRIVKPIPLMGHIAFGVIDRGTNVLQVRPYTWCPHSCIFCSVDAGPSSRTRQAEFMVDTGWLASWVDLVAEAKGVKVEALIDGVGEPIAHPGILDLIERLRSSRWVDRVAIETHGGFLSKRLVEKLDEAGLNRINLSIDAVNRDKARLLVGVQWYNPSRILEVAEWAIKNTGVDVVLTPVLVPGVNEDEMEHLIEWARSVGAGVKSGWPTGVLIQNYQVHKWGRNPPGVRPWGWSRFYKWLKQLEEKTGYRLRVNPEKIGFRKTPRVAEVYKPGDRVKVHILGQGWHVGELLAVDYRWKRIIAVLGRNASPGSTIIVKIVRSKDNIYVAR
ncbi:MAG: radical SAM protein [Desulfurococcales archaeon]|nr:radical SAM protein [Desulfurococcales archaeon]MCE4604992.1 radical SAM protein [Desulfurococcales archaeon]